MALPAPIPARTADVGSGTTVAIWTIPEPTSPAQKSCWVPLELYTAKGEDGGVTGIACHSVSEMLIGECNVKSVPFVKSSEMEFDVTSKSPKRVAPPAVPAPPP